MADNDASERRVYVLPKEQIDRIRAFQTKTGLASEVEAVRRLLDTALQLRDTIEDLLVKIGLRFKEERDLRAIGRDLIGHALVNSVSVEENQLQFRFSGGIQGAITSEGKTSICRYDNNWELFPAKPSQKAKINAGGWDTTPPNDLDDEIPF